MKKIFFTVILFLATGIMFAQETGLHITFGGNFGKMNFVYQLDGGAHKNQTGYGGYLGAQYFFNRHWGVSLSGEFVVYNTMSLYDDKSFLFNEETDNEGDSYNLKIHLKNWKENQRTYFLEMPIMALYQHKFGKKEHHGFYLGAGIKTQIPVSNSFRNSEGEVRVSGYYPRWNLPLGEEGLSVEIPQHGFGNNENRQWAGLHNLKAGLALVGEFGFLIGLSPRVDLTLGISADYGFTNISKRMDNLLGPIEGKTQQEGQYISEMIYYNGILNSNQTTRINTSSVRGKVGLRIKIGKLKEREEDSDDPIKKLAEILNNMESGGKRDTIIINPVVLPIYLPSSNDDVQERAGLGTGSGIRQTGDDGGFTSDVRTKKGGTIPQTVVEDLEESIYFDLNECILTAKAKEVLNQKVALMKKYPQAIISVVGHTCNIGSGNYNDVLSRDRAEAAKYYLIKKGISPARIITLSEGMKNPTYPNTSEQNRELNRRVDFYMSY